MKKIFTLIAAVAMTLSAQAQGQYRVQENDKFTSGQEITSVPNMTVVMGEDTWNDGKLMDDKLEGYVAYTTGNTNPSDANGKKPGAAAFDATTAKGCVVFFKPAIAGKLTIGIKQNKGEEKPVYLFEGAQTEAAKLDGQAESQYLLLTANVKAGETYCLYQAATKVGFFGFDFTASEGGGEGEGGEGGDVEPAKEYFFDYIGEDANKFTYANGATLQITGNETKNLGKGAALTIDGKSYTSIKLSNGAQNTLTLPEGVTATNIVLYSYINAENDGEKGDSFWKEVAGTEYATAEDNPGGKMACYKGDVSNPDVKEFTFAATNVITFTNKGNQVCFVIKVSDSTTAINNVTSTINVNAPMFNLAGQKVGKDFKGVVIMNGKKFMNK